MCLGKKMRDERYRQKMAGCVVDLYRRSGVMGQKEQAFLASNFPHINFLIFVIVVEQISPMKTREEGYFDMR